MIASHQNQQVNLFERLFSKFHKMHVLANIYFYIFCYSVDSIHMRYLLLYLVRWLNKGNKAMVLVESTCDHLHCKQLGDDYLVRFNDY